MQCWIEAQVTSILNIPQSRWSGSVWENPIFCCVTARPGFSRGKKGSCTAIDSLVPWAAACLPGESRPWDSAVSERGAGMLLLATFSRGGGKGKPFRKRIFTIVLQQQDTLFLCLLGAAVCCPAFFFFRWANTDLLSLLLRALDCFSREGLVSCRQADVKDQHEQQKTQEEKLWSRGDWFDRSQGKSRWQREWDIC